MMTPAEYTAMKRREKARERQRRFRERHPEKSQKPKKSSKFLQQNEAEEQ
jgi:hypothetical protein